MRRLYLNQLVFSRPETNRVAVGSRTINSRLGPGNLLTCNSSFSEQLLSWLNILWVVLHRESRPLAGRLLSNLHLRLSYQKMLNPTAQNLKIQKRPVRCQPPSRRTPLVPVSSKDLKQEPPWPRKRLANCWRNRKS